MDAAGLAKLITLLCLVAIFIAAVLITPRIWHANDGAKGAEKKRGNSRAEQGPKTAAGGVEPPPARPDWFAQLPLRVPALVGMCYCAGCVTGLRLPTKRSGSTGRR